MGNAHACMIFAADITFFFCTICLLPGIMLKFLLDCRHLSSTLRSTSSLDTRPMSPALLMAFSSRISLASLLLARCATHLCAPSEAFLLPMLQCPFLSIWLEVDRTCSSGLARCTTQTIGQTLRSAGGLKSWQTITRKCHSMVSGLT